MLCVFCVFCVLFVVFKKEITSSSTQTVWGKAW